jgi:hypothetical protein
MIRFCHTPWSDYVKGLPDSNSVIEKSNSSAVKGVAVYAPIMN